MKKRAVRLAALALVAIILAGCGGPSGSQSGAAPSPANDLLNAVRSKGVLVVSTDANYKPQSFLNADGSWVGFDVDVAREIGRRLGVKAVFQDSNFDVITAGGWNGRWDINVDSMAITAARSKLLWFTHPYYFVPASFAVHVRSSARSVNDMAGKRIGVGAATTYEAYLNHKLATARIAAPSGVRTVPYRTDELALDDLAKGDGVRLDAALTALPTIRSAIAAGRPLRVIEPPVFSDTSAIALDRSSPVSSQTLLWEIDGIIDKMHRDGTLTRLSLKYYGIDLTIRR